MKVIHLNFFQLQKRYSDLGSKQKLKKKRFSGGSMDKLQTYRSYFVEKLNSHAQKITPSRLFLLLSFSTCSVFAEQEAYNLPSLGEGLGTTVENRNLPLHQQLSPVAQYLKQLTHKQLTDNSAIYLAPQGIKLETQFSENMSSELVTKGSGEISFTFKFSF